MSGLEVHRHREQLGHGGNVPCEVTECSDHALYAEIKILQLFMVRRNDGKHGLARQFRDLISHEPYRDPVFCPHVIIVPIKQINESKLGHGSGYQVPKNDGPNHVFQ